MQKCREVLVYGVCALAGVVLVLFGSARRFTDTLMFEAAERRFDLEPSRKL